MQDEGDQDVLLVSLQHDVADSHGGSGNRLERGVGESQKTDETMKHYKDIMCVLKTTMRVVGVPAIDFVSDIQGQCPKEVGTCS